MHRPEKASDIGTTLNPEQSNRFNQIDCDSHGYKEEEEREIRELFIQRFQKFYDSLFDDKHNKVAMDKLCNSLMQGIVNDKRLDIKTLKDKILDYKKAISAIDKIEIILGNK